MTDVRWNDGPTVEQGEDGIKAQWIVSGIESNEWIQARPSRVIWSTNDKRGKNPFRFPLSTLFRCLVGV